MNTIHHDTSTDLKFIESSHGWTPAGPVKHFSEDMGYSITYSHESAPNDIFASFYIYDNEQPDIPNGIDNDVVRNEKKGVLLDIGRAQFSLGYRIVEASEESTATTDSGIKFIQEYYESIYRGSNTRTSSYVLITGRNSKFIKVRLSFDKTDETSKETILNSLMSAIDVFATGKSANSACSFWSKLRNRKTQYA